MTSELIQVFEDAVDAAVEALTSTFEDVEAAFGPRPFGALEADRLSRLDYFLSVADDPAALERMVAERAQFGGRPAAEAWLWREMTAMYAMLDRAGGPGAVAGAVAMRNLGHAEKALRRLDRIEELPQADVRGPAGVVDATALVMEPGDGGYAGLPGVGAA